MMTDEGTMLEPGMRRELDPLPPRMRALPKDDRGYPVPWFVGWVDGRPEFRVMDRAKWLRAVRESRCWVCGGPLGVWKTFVLGPMCGVNRTTAEPPCHRDCAEWSARNCPFLSRPQMRRREGGVTEEMRDEVAGVMIPRNPGVALLWTTRQYVIFNDGRGRPLIEIGEPHAVSWWAEGRPATRREVETSVNSGLPLLLETCDQERSLMARAAARAELERRAVQFVELYPTA